MRVGHNQSPSVAKYRPDLPGLQYMSVNFWRNPGIVTVYDPDGNIVNVNRDLNVGAGGPVVKDKFWYFGSYRRQRIEFMYPTLKEKPFLTTIADYTTKFTYLLPVVAKEVYGGDQTLLGTLDLGLSQAPLQRTMGMLQNRMIVFTGMILVLTVGVVCALLYRQILMPIRKLADFTEKQGSVNLEQDIPEVSGDMARLAKAFQGMARRLREMESRGPDKR